jgi:hypothetical protein
MNFKPFLLATAFGFVSTAVMASCTSQTFGNQTFTNCSDGSNYNSMQFGNQTMTTGRDANGNFTRGNTMQFGNQKFYDGPMYDDNQ